MQADGRLPLRILRLQLLRNPTPKALTRPPPLNPPRSISTHPSNSVVFGVGSALKVGALLLGLVFVAHDSLAGQFPARGFAKMLNPAQARERIDEYRASIEGSAGKAVFHSAYSFRFKFRHMPRRGPETLRFASISGPALGSGIYRVELENDAVFLLENPRDPRLLAYSRSDRQIKELPKEFVLRPMVEGMNQTYFDLLMPFVFWEEEYLKSGKVAGRPCHLYNFACPSWVTQAMPDWQSVSLALDDAYQAPLRVEIFSRDLQPLRSTTLRTFKKTGDEWMVKTMDCMKYEDRSNTRIEMIAAATRLDLSPEYFQKESFMLPIPIPAEAFERF